MSFACRKQKSTCNPELFGALSQILLLSKIILKIITTELRKTLYNKNATTAVHTFYVTIG